jgi:hypothetical protein
MQFISRSNLSYLNKLLRHVIWKKPSEINRGYLVLNGSRVITNDMSDYINLLVRIAHIVCNHSLYHQQQSVFEKSLHFQTPDITKFLMYSANLNMNTTGDTTHTRMIFNFWPGIGKHFIVNVLCNSDDCHTTYSHSALFHNKECIFINTQNKKIHMS